VKDRKRARVFAERGKRSARAKAYSGISMRSCVQEYSRTLPILHDLLYEYFGHKIQLVALQCRDHSRSPFETLSCELGGYRDNPLCRLSFQCISNWIPSNRQKICIG